MKPWVPYVLAIVVIVYGWVAAILIADHFEKRKRK